MQNFKAIYVPLIALVPWILAPTILFFTSIKPMREEWTAKHQARDTSRQAYGSDTTYTGNWPPEGMDVANVPPKLKPGADDKLADEQAFQAAKKQREETKAAKAIELKQHTDQLDAVTNRFMKDIRRDELDMTAPDRFLYEALERLRDREGPRLIAFLHRTYPNLFFAYSGSIPAPPINLNAGNMPAVGTEGRLSWPLGIASTSMSVWGLYPDLLRFVESFPERYDRTIEITAFSLEREAFDHRGVTLMRMDIDFAMYVWPNGVPLGGAAPAAAAAPAGGSGEMPLEGSAPAAGGSAAPAEAAPVAEEGGSAAPADE